MDKVKVGIVGCGGISTYHISNLLRVPEASIVALADINPKSFEKLVDLIPAVKEAPFFMDYKRMLEEVDMDAVEVLTPHAVHYEQALTALDRGLHVLVEKPMVCNAEQALEVVRRSRESGKIVMVSYQRHLMGSFKLAKRMIMDGRLGNLEYIQAFLAQNWVELTKGTWRHDPRLSCGGQLIDSGSHILDFVLWASGLTPEMAFAYSDNLGCVVDVNTSLSIRFEGGAVGSISILGDSPVYMERYFFLGSKAAMTLDERGLRIVERGSRFTLEAFKYPETLSPDRGFIDTILGRSENPSPPVCGLKVAQLTDAAFESISKGKPVRVKHVDI